MRTETFALITAFLFALSTKADPLPKPQPNPVAVAGVPLNSNSPLYDGPCSPKTECTSAQAGNTQCGICNPDSPWDIVRLPHLLKPNFACLNPAVSSPRYRVKLGLVH